MKTLWRLLLGIVILGVVALTGYGAYVYLLPKWYAILFYAYVAVGFFWLLVGFRKRMQEERNKTARESVGEVVIEANRGKDFKSRLNALRDQITVVLATIANVAVWPAVVIPGIILTAKNQGRNMRSREIATRMATTLAQNYMSLFSLCVVACILTYEYGTRSASAYGMTMLYLMIAHTTLRHIQYSISTVGLPASLRRSTSQPYLAFLGIIAADFLVLVLTLTAVARPSRSSGLSIAELRATADAILRAQEPIKLIRGMSLNGYQILTGIVGLFFYLALLKTLWDLREFKRKDEDYVAMASVECELGRFSTALAHLDNVKSWDAQGRSVKVAALLGVNQIALAERETGLILEERRMKKMVNSVFDGMWGQCLVAPISNEVKLELLQRAIHAEVGDLYLLAGLYGMAGDDELNKELVKGFKTIFEEVRDRYPLTAAQMALNDRDLAAVVDALSRVKLDDPAVEIAQRVLSILAAIKDPNTSKEDDMKSFRSWAKANLQRISELSMEIAISQDLSVAGVQIISLIPIATVLAPERVEEIRFLVRSLKKDPKLLPVQVNLLTNFEAQVGGT